MHRVVSNRIVAAQSVVANRRSQMDFWSISTTAPNLNEFDLHYQFFSGAIFFATLREISSSDG
jgi:hypothetical protein